MILSGGLPAMGARFRPFDESALGDKVSKTKALKELSRRPGASVCAAYARPPTGEDVPAVRFSVQSCSSCSFAWNWSKGANCLFALIFISLIFTKKISKGRTDRKHSQWVQKD